MGPISKESLWRKLAFLTILAQKLTKICPSSPREIFEKFGTSFDEIQFPMLHIVGFQAPDE